MRRQSLFLCATVLLWIGINSPLQAQGKKTKREAQVAESEQPKSVTGGVSFQVEKPFEKTFDSAMEYLKKGGFAVDSAEKDSGQIMTTIDIAGDKVQTGTRLQLTLTKGGDSQTTVRVAVTKQTRKKSSKPGPWSDPEVDQEESAQAAEAMKKAL